MWYCENCNMFINDKLKMCVECNFSPEENKNSKHNKDKFPLFSFTCKCDVPSDERPDDTERIYVLQNSEDELDFDFIPCNLILGVKCKLFKYLLLKDQTDKNKVNNDTYLVGTIDTAYGKIDMRKYVL